jgi:uncharacterized protein (DUF1015 family)
MATIRPFRGVRYNGQKVDISSVISQPYDRVRYGLQEKYHDQSPYNVVRIIKGKEQPEEYGGARDCYERWRANEILLRERVPALYVYHQTFVVKEQPVTRKALIAAFQLTPFDEGILLPHEQTHSDAKADRLRLLRALEVNTGQVFLLYPDPQNMVASLLDAAIAGHTPQVDAFETYERDVRQQLWVVQDPETIQAVQRQVAPMHNLIIADGHHRYETALDYRHERLSTCASTADKHTDAAYNYCMAGLVSMDDPGLVILPTHREIVNSPRTHTAELLTRANALFDIAPAPDLDTCLARMADQERRHAFGLFVKDSYHVLVLKNPERIDSLIPGERSATWKSLDVSIAHEILLEQVIGLSLLERELQTHLRYHRDPNLAVGNVRAGRGDIALLLNPTRIDQVKACAQKGVKMPPKSTDFYPKMVAGLTMLPVGKGEHL